MFRIVNGLSVTNFNVLQDFSSEEVTRIINKDKKILFDTLNKEGRLLITGEDLHILSKYELNELKNIIIGSTKFQIELKILI